MSDVKVIYDTPNLPFLLQGKDILHKDGLFISYYGSGNQDETPLEAIEKLKEQASAIGANAIIISKLPQRSRSDYRWFVGANAVLITDSE